MLDVLQMNHTVQCTYAYLLRKYIVSLYLITYQQTRVVFFFWKLGVLASLSK